MREKRKQHEQNIVIVHVHKSKGEILWERVKLTAIAFTSGYVVTVGMYW